MNICSKYGGSRACECGSCGGNGNGNGVTMCSAGLKKIQQQKQKLAKIMKRGPGVAELEKILREQETTDLPMAQRGNNEGFSVSSNSSILHSYVPPFSPAIGSMHGHILNHSLGRNGGGGSSEGELFHMNLTPWKLKTNLNQVVDGSQSDDSGSSPPRNLASEFNHANCSYPAMVSEKNKVLPPAMMNQFHGSFKLEDEEKIVAGIKNTHTPSLDKSVIPPLNESYGDSSYNHTNECYRNAKWGSTLELNNKKFNSDNDASVHANFSPFVVSDSEVPPPPMPLFQNVHSNVDVFPCQVTENKMENSSGHDRKPFFNFLEVKGKEEVIDASGSNNGGHGKKGGIDLTLKL